MKGLNPLTSAKPVMTKLKDLFVSLVNMDVLDGTKIKFIHCKLSEQFVLQHCEYIFCICRHAESLQMYVVSAPFE